jgi:hypothetical protein
VSEELAQIVSKAMSKNRDDRYRSVAELMHDLGPLNDSIMEDMGTDAARMVSQFIDAAKNAVVKNTQGLPNANSLLSSSYASATTLTGTAANVEEKPKGRWLLRLVAVITVGIVVALAAVVRLHFLEQGEAPRRDASPAIPLPAPESHSQPSPSGPSSPKGLLAKASAAAASTAPKEGAPALFAQAKKPPASSRNKVTLEITNLPPEARVFLGGKSIPNPYKLKRSSAETTLRVNCPGYLPHIQKVTPSKDLAFAIHLKKIPTRGSAQKGGRIDASSKGRKDNRWLAEP